MMRQPHAYTVDQQATISGMMNIRRQTGGVDAQLAPAGHPCPHCELHDTLIQRLQRFGPDELAPADERGIVWHAPKVDPAEPAQDQAISHTLFRFLVAPVVQM